MKHFPEATASTLPDGEDGSKWLESALENLKTHLVSFKSSLSSTSSNVANNNNVTNNNHLTNRSDAESNNLNSAVNGDSRSSAAENELVLLQNAQLKTTIEDYKNIIAETVSKHYPYFEVAIFVLLTQESMLKNLESKVREQDAYWTKVVLMKDNEIENLKTITEKS